MKVLTTLLLMIAGGRFGIFQRIETLDLDPEEEALLVEEMGKPVDVDCIIQGATSPEVAAEICTASLFVVQVDSPAERAYLAMLAARLRLPDELVTTIHEQVDPLRIAAGVSPEATA